MRPPMCSPSRGRRRSSPRRADMHIYIADLVSGKRYVLQVHAIGGSTGRSHWSDPLTHRSLSV
jgi:hypothetical protein